MTTTAFDDQFNPDPNSNDEPVDKFTETLSALSLRFTSGNSVPVERAVISRDELEVILSAIHEYGNTYDIKDVEKYFPDLLT